MASTTKTRTALYATVSTTGHGQDVELQLDELREVIKASVIMKQEHIPLLHTIMKPTLPDQAQAPAVSGAAAACAAPSGPCVLRFVGTSRQAVASSAQDFVL